MGEFLLKSIKTNILLLTIVTFFSCGKPTEPKLDPQTDKKAYFFEQSGSQKLYIYSTSKNELDSTVLSYTNIDYIQVSPDGKSLYLVRDNSITIIDTKNFSFINDIEIPNIYKCAISPNNQYLALSGKGFYILRTSNLEIIYSDTSLITYNAYFSNNNQSVYCAVKDTLVSDFSYVQKIDLTSNPISKNQKVFDNQDIKIIKVSKDEQLWFLTTSLSPFSSAFEVYDTINDSIIFLFTMCQAQVDTEISPDFKFVYFTNPGNFDCVLEPNIQIYDIDANNLYTEFSTQIDSVYKEIDTLYLPPIFDIKLNPDNTQFIFLSGVNNSALGQVYSINLGKLKIELNKNYWDSHYYFSNLTI